MPKPRRRRRFFALEGRFDVGDSGELHGLADPANPDESAAHGFVEEKIVESDQEERALPDAPATPGTLETPSTDPLPQAFQLNREARTRVSPPRPFTFWSLLFLGVGLLIGALAGRLSSPSARTPSAPRAPDVVNPLSAADQNDLDMAYAVRHERQHEKAEKLFTALLDKHPDWAPMQVELGRTLFYAGKSYEATTLLKAAVQEGKEPAEANFLLAVLGKARKSYAEAEANFARAVAINPTLPEYYFFWGECLRAEGKLLEATAKFRSAILRNQYETATSLYQAKLWLTSIEAGQESSDGIKEQIDAALAQPHPPMEACVAAAARSLMAGDFAATAGHLARARRRADPTVFRYIISDPFFAAAATRPEMAALFSPDPPPTRISGPPTKDNAL